MLFTITVLHGVLAAVLVASLGWIVLEMARLPHAGSAERAIRAGWLALASVLLVNITGMVSYLTYRLPDPTSPRSIILQTAPWVHRVLFESMEYVGLMVPIMVGVVIAATIIYRQRLPEERGTRTQLGRLVYATLFIVFLIAITGFVPSVIAFVK